LGAATGAGLGATSFVEPGESRGKNAAIGGAAGAGGALALGMGSKLVNTAKGLPETERSALLKKWGIRSTAAEQADGRASWTDTFMERLPGFMGGTKNWRIKQHQEAWDAAKRFFGKYAIDPLSEDTAAMKLANDAHIDNLYEKVRANAANVPMGSAPEVKVATGNLLNRYPTVFESIQDNKVKSILRNIYGDVKDQTVQTGLVSPSGRPITRQVTPEFGFDEMWELRKGVGKEIRDAKTDTARGQMKALYGAVSEDMETMLQRAGGPEANDFRAANEAFKQYSVKFDVMREAYDKAAGTTSATELFSPKKFSTALKKLANDPQYKKNVRWTQGEIDEMTGLANIFQVVKRSAQHIENPPTGNRWGPLAIAGGIEGAAFQAAGAAGALKTAGTTTALGWVTRFLTTTEPGKRLALSASKFAPDSPGMNWVVNQLYKQVPKFAAEMSQVDLPQAELGESIKVE
jgi:hypothetical protein